MFNIFKKTAPPVIEETEKTVELDRYGISQESYDKLNKLVNQYNDKHDSNLRYKIERDCRHISLGNTSEELYLNYRVYSDELGKNLEILTQLLYTESFPIKYPMGYKRKKSCKLSLYSDMNFGIFEKSIKEAMKQEEVNEKGRIEDEKKRVAEEKERLAQKKIIEEIKQRYKYEIARLEGIIESRFGETEEYDSTLDILTIIDKLQGRLGRF